MDINLAREIVTVVSFLAFIGILVYALSPGNAEPFERAARLPFDEDGQ